MRDVKCSFAIFPKPSTFVKPAKSPFHNPAFWKNLELMRRVALDDGNSCADDLSNTIRKRLPSIAAVTQDIPHARQRKSIVLYHENRARFVWNIGGCYKKRLWQTVCIYRDRSLNTGNFFIRVIAFFFSGISVLDALGVDDTKTRRFEFSIADTP